MPSDTHKMASKAKVNLIKVSGGEKGGEGAEGGGNSRGASGFAQGPGRKNTNYWYQKEKEGQTEEEDTI